MKRMIACEKCSWKPQPYYAGEWFKRVRGTSKKDMLCDWCCPPVEIKEGDKCAAESMGRDDGSAPYYPWENEFVKSDVN